MINRGGWVFVDQLPRYLVVLGMGKRMDMGQVGLFLYISGESFP